MQSQLSNDVTTNNEIEDINLITLPPGYRFNPNDIELIDYYLKQKLQGVHIVPPRIHDVDVYKFSPQQLENSYKFKGEDTMYFFTPRSKKYENGQRPDRAVENHGFWKATGKENSVMNNDVEIGFKRSLVFYTDMERQRRNTKKYSFRQPDLKELRNLTSYVLDPLGFKARFGKLLPLLTTQLLPTLEEYAYLVGIPILDQLLFSGLESIPTSREIADMLHIDESLVGAHMTTKGGIQGLPSEFLIAQATVIFSTLNPVPTLLGDTYFSLHMRNAKGGGAIVCCLPLLYKWFISHLPQTVAFKENKGCLRWSTRLMSLTNDDISWYNRVYDGVQIIDSCGEFPNVPLLGTGGGINYNPILARRQLGFPLKDKPNNILLEGMFFQEGKDPPKLEGQNGPRLVQDS
ncbi:hypothetical protein KIW84_014642 [Lathyrus oleraceus]|uniref:NAC domain-containing protein n=1 Tax=Pisum sativum TaxID=3888 RepID=A0A9D5BNE6_PEA|nr:hypothetical protein KIW84_014642 [Pisum sativum]